MTSQGSFLMAAAWPVERREAVWLRTAVLVVLGTAPIAVCAKIQVPMWPVPMTMQTFAVLVIGGAYGWRLGGATVLAYLAEGAAGLPVFAGATAGPAYFAGPTTGYLIGFVLSAMLIGWLAERGWDRDLPRLVIALAAASVVTFVAGVAWLAVLIGLSAAIANGFTPFIPGMILKLALAAALLTAGWHMVRRRRG